MEGTMEFSYDSENDIVIATPHWRIETKEDSEIWYNQWVDYMSKFDKKMDAIMILNDFYVKAAYSVEWSKYRAKILQEYTRFTYRINPELTTGIFIKTSGARYNVSTKEASSVEAAIEAIKKDRKEELEKK